MAPFPHSGEVPSSPEQFPAFPSRNQINSFLPFTMCYRPSVSCCTVLLNTSPISSNKERGIRLSAEQPGLYYWFSPYCFVIISSPLYPTVLSEALTAVFNYCRMLISFYSFISSCIQSSVKVKKKKVQNWEKASSPAFPPLTIRHSMLHLPVKVFLLTVTALRRMLNKDIWPGLYQENNCAENWLMELYQSRNRVTKIPY